MPFLSPRDVVTFVRAETAYGLSSNEETAKSILASLDLQDTLILCSRLNAIIAGPGSLAIDARTRHAMGILQHPREERRILEISERYGGYNVCRPFFRGQLLELMRLALRHCRRDWMQDSYASRFNRKQFLKAALIASGIWTERTIRPGHDATALGPDDIAEHIAYLRKVVEETNVAPNIGGAMGRGWLLFTEFLPKHYPSFEAEFYEAANMTFKQYFTCLCGLTASINVGHDLEGRIDRINPIGGPTRYRGVFPRYLALDSQTPEGMALSSSGTKAEFERAMWRWPIIRFDDGASIIADPIFYSAKLSVGPLFVPLAGHPERVKALLGAFGDAFEEYSSEILRSMFKENAHFNLKKMDGKNTAFEVDALLTEEQSTIVIETKAKFLNEDLVSGNGYESFIQHLRDKYVSRGNAIWQLATITEAVSAGDWSAMPTEIEEARRILQSGNATIPRPGNEAPVVRRPSRRQDSAADRPDHPGSRTPAGAHFSRPGDTDRASLGISYRTHRSRSPVFVSQLSRAFATRHAVAA